MKRLIVLFAISIAVMSGCSNAPDTTGGNTVHDPFVVYGSRQNVPLGAYWYLLQNNVSEIPDAAYNFVNIDLVLSKVEVTFSSNSFPQTTVRILQNDVDVADVIIPAGYTGVLSTDFNIQFHGGDSVLLVFDTTVPSGSYPNAYCNISVKAIFEN